MHETDDSRINPDAISEGEWQAPRTTEAYHLVSERRQSLLSRQRSGMITIKESEELDRLATLSSEYAAGVASMIKDLFTGEGGRRYDLGNPEDRAEMREKMRLYREEPRTTTDAAESPILPPQADHPNSVS